MYEDDMVYMHDGTGTGNKAWVFVPPDLSDFSLPNWRGTKHSYEVFQYAFGPDVVERIWEYLDTCWQMRTSSSYEKTTLEHMREGDILIFEMAKFHMHMVWDLTPNQMETFLVLFYEMDDQDWADAVNGGLGIKWSAIMRYIDMARALED